MKPNLFVMLSALLGAITVAGPSYGDVEIDGVPIRSGDYVIAGRDGVVFIPGDIAATVTLKSEKVIGAETLVRKPILEAEAPQRACLKYGPF